MANKLTRKKPNRLLTSRNNYYNNGGFWANPFSGENGMEVKKAVTLAAGAAVGQIGGGLIGGGLLSGAGNVLQGLSGVAAAIPGPWGAVASAGLGVLGGLTNRMFGSKMNTENIAQVEANINNLNSFLSNASDFDTLASNWANADVGMTFNDSYIGKDGWFSNKAKNKAADLRRQIDAGNAWVQNTLTNNAENIGTTQMQNLLSNYAAFGGPLLYSKGGSIHIKPENRGKFTETKRRTGKTTEELTHSSNPLTRKRAIFAQNAKKWHHAFGGDLMTHGANFDTGITLIGNGDTHENNPYEGVPMGVDPEGTPNLVEEGEVIFNDYVFSKRLKVPEEMRKKYKLKGSKLSFAEAATQMSKESEERPNDPISKAGLEDSMMKLMIAQEQLRTKRNKTNTFSKGGKMGRIYAGELDDPYSLVLDLGLGPVNPSRIWGLLPLQTETSASPKNNMGIVLGGYTSNPTIIKPGESTISEIISTQKTKYPSPTVKSSDTSRDTGDDLSMSPTWMRYIPAFASGAMSITDALGLTNKPDYSDAESILEASRGIGTYQPVKFKPVGNYLTYNPFDLDFAVNQANAESGAARRAIMNTSGGNRAQAMAGILAADNTALNQLGALRRGAAEDNLKQRLIVEDFNRATNMFNSEGFFKADAANQAALAQAKDFLLRGIMAASELRLKERQALAAAKSANLSNFINSLGDIGRENFSRNMIVSDPSKYYTINSNGEVSYKNSFYDLSEAEQDYITGHANRKSKNKNERSKGGYLTIKRK